MFDGIGVLQLLTEDNHLVVDGFIAVPAPVLHWRRVLAAAGKQGGKAHQGGNHLSSYHGTNLLVPQK